MTTDGVDVKLRESLDGGEIEVENGLVALDGGLETAAYLSLFGGNDDDPGARESSLQWWGNYSETEPVRRYRSETQNLLQSIPNTSGNRLRMVDAVERDLAWMITEGVCTSIDVEVTVPQLNRVLITVAIIAEEVTTLKFGANWFIDSRGSLGGDPAPVLPVEVVPRGIRVVPRMSQADVSPETVVTYACNGDTLECTLSASKPITLLGVTGTLATGLMSLPNDYTVSGDGTTTVVISWATVFDDETIDVTIDYEVDSVTYQEVTTGISGCKAQTTAAMWQTPGAEISVLLNMSFPGGSASNGSRQFQVLDHIQVSDFSPCPGQTGTLAAYISDSTTGAAFRTEFKFDVYSAWNAGAFEFSRPLTFVLYGGLAANQVDSYRANPITTPTDTEDSGAGSQSFVDISGGNCQNVVEVVRFTVDHLTGAISDIVVS